MSKIVKVYIERKSIDSEIHIDDINLPSMLNIEVDDSVPLYMIATCALDVFHDNIPIKNLDDFDIILHFNGAEIQEPTDVTGFQSLSDQGRIV